MITCAHCGAKNADGARFCIKCGKRLIHVPPPKPTPRGPAISPAGAVLIGLVVMALSAGVVYYLLRPSLGPTALAEATPGASPVISQGTTDHEGKAVVVDAQGSGLAIIQVEDKDSRLPVSGVQVYFLKRGSNYLAVAVDPQRRYLGTWTEGLIDEASTSSSSPDAVGLFFLPSSAHAQQLPLILLFLRAISKVSSFGDLIAYLQDPPDLAYWGVLYYDTCWSGEELVNYVGSAGLILPGIDEVVGVLLGEMDEVARAMFFLSQHVMEEDAKEYLLSLDRPVRIRTYHLGIPALGMVPVGWCEVPVTPTARVSPRPTVVPTPEAFRIASPTPEPMGPEFVISDEPAYQYRPAISGNIVVWYDALCDCNKAKDMSTGDQVGISDYWGSQGPAAISGKFVVWADSRNGNSDVHCRNLATGEEFSIVTNPAEQRSPAISGSIVVWADRRNDNWDIYAKDLSTGEEFPVATEEGDQKSPAISGSIVVWADQRNDNWDIYAKDLSTGEEFPVTTEEADEQLPAVSGTIVVWVEGSGDLGKVWGKDISTGELVPIVTDHSAEAERPAVDGSIVAWVSYRLARGWAVLAKDISTGAEFQVTTYSLGNVPSRPAVSGNLVVWGGLSGYRGDIYGRRLNVE